MQKYMTMIVIRSYHISYQTQLVKVMAHKENVRQNFINKQCVVCNNLYRGPLARKNRNENVEMDDGK